eukprot:symbB.v1.2.036517.t1/scaffold5178.1/size30123/3
MKRVRAEQVIPATGAARKVPQSDDLGLTFYTETSLWTRQSGSALRSDEGSEVPRASLVFATMSSAM